MELKEFTINNSDDYIFGELLLGEYDLLCFSCYIWNIDRILYLVENIKKAQPSVKILLGGPEVTWRGVEIMKKHGSVDFIIGGEGEENFIRLIEKLSETDGEFDFDGIGGLHYRREEKIYINPPPSQVDFNFVPFPFNALVPEPDKTIYYESVRGCPFSCSYCISSLEKGVRPLSIERVKKDLSYFIYKKVKQVKFVDRTFNYDNKRSLEILSYLIEKDNGVTNFHFEMCGDLISKELLGLLSNVRPGMFQFEIGIQSTSEETLEAINRRCDFTKLSMNVSHIISMGNIHVHLDLISGLPYESYEVFEKSFNDVYFLKPHMLQLGFLKMLPGTLIREKGEEFSYVYRSKPPYEVISNKFITAKEMAKLKMVEMILNLYYNRGGFQKSLDLFSYECGDSPFAFYEDFAEYYYSKGFQHRSQNKEDLYRIIYSYINRIEELEESKAERLKSMLEEDMTEHLNPEAVRKFMKTGWKLQK